MVLTADFLSWTSCINKAINLKQGGDIISALNLPCHFTFPLQSLKRPAMTHRGCSAVMLRFKKKKVKQLHSFCTFSKFSSIIITVFNMLPVTCQRVTCYLHKATKLLLTIYKTAVKHACPLTKHDKSSDQLCCVVKSQ